MNLPTLSSTHAKRTRVPWLRTGHQQNTGNQNLIAKGLQKMVISEEIEARTERQKK